MKPITIQKNMKKYNLGFSLIELMVAMVIGIIVLLGLVSLFTNSSILNRAQTGLSTLQENGRYAITRLKDDIEQAGRKHCTTMGMPSELFTNWNQGYAMTSWMVDKDVNFNAYGSTAGLPNRGQIELSTAGQLPDGTVNTSTLDTFPLDPRYFIHGLTTQVGADPVTSSRSFGTSDGSRAAETDVLTVRYLNGGHRVDGGGGNQFNFANSSETSGDLPTLIADCDKAYISEGTWTNNTVTLDGTNVPSFALKTDTRAFDLTKDFKTVSYFVGIDNDPNRPGRMISSLYRSENGNVQQLVEGVERFDVFYLAQLQTGHVARLTASEVQSVKGGGADSVTGAIKDKEACILPPSSEAVPGSSQLANGEGCLWRSIYAMEIHILLNTVNDSSMSEEETYIYSPDKFTSVKPSPTLESGLDRQRMYRREFTATIPIRSYTL